MVALVAGPPLPVLPGVPVPAMVVIVPEVSIFRMRPRARRSCDRGAPERRGGGDRDQDHG
ncbi:MAG: hypothetical protein FJ148_13060 [Deltaproteobacteria bacterium]|nr:hypothetical protein [Deltaproteobacteria bacterium]